MNALRFRFVRVLAALLLIVLAIAPAAGVQAAATSPLDFQNAMRKLWEDHVTWTRLYIVSVAAGLPDTDLTAQRLLQNQVDIGNAIKPYYGEDAGNKLTALLKDHILGAAALLAAAKAGDNAKVQTASTAWYKNGDDIASFLNGANPKSWPLDVMKMNMKMHLDQTLQEATDRLQGKFDADIKDYDQVHEHILNMADALSSGIIAQFPDKFGPATDAKIAARALAMRKLWEDHVTWTRLYIVSVAAGLPDTDLTAQRLLQNQVDIGNAIKPYYGEDAGNKLTALLKDHILGAAALLAAAKAGDNAKVQTASTAWYKNGDDIASFLNGANPKSWPLDVMKMNMKMHLDQTLQEATDRLQGKFAADIKDYDQVHEHILNMADALSSGITAQFPAAGAAALPRAGDAPLGRVAVGITLSALLGVLFLVLGWILYRQSPPSAGR